ncbi:Protein dopey [Gossypium australe]|uniref:Protein dopey n=1 Tax=Gossypium australe TaxID=47621 RepID=A0A5B6XCU4_9ROSI|nr:Protein dopey [Gossypium australe]
MNVQASKTHQEGIYINRVLTLHSYLLFNISLFNSYTVVSFFNLHCLPTKFYGGFIACVYKQLLEQNKHYIQNPPTVEKCNLLSKQLIYTRLASIPSRYEAFQKEMDYVKLMWKKRNEWKIEDAGIATLFGLECFAWYCTGETVGRGFTFTGYYI